MRNLLFASAFSIISIALFITSGVDSVPAWALMILSHMYILKLEDGGGK